MNLHRSSKPEWEDVSVTDMNVWQRMASRTNGIITPGNIVSLIGLTLFVIGLMHIVNDSYWAGLILVIIGRLADLLDGYAAETTKTKSPLGEAVDASIDKFEAALAIGVLLFTGVLPIWVALLLAVHTVYGTLVSLLASRRNGRIHPSTSGKIATALEWALIGTWVLYAIEDSTFIYVLAAVLSAAFAVFALLSVIDYRKQYHELR